LPTAGEQRETAIAANCKASNKVQARLFAFGVGFDVNARLLDRLSGSNAGTSEYVRPDEDIEAHVARFYAKLTSPVLTGIKIELTNTDINRTYPRDIPDLFEGGQLVWVGRYRQPGRTTLRMSGRVGSESRTFEYAMELAGSDKGPTYAFVERLWAMRRIGHIIDQIDLNGPNKELTDELVALSTKHGILTPYTSFLADERVPLHFRAENARRATEALDKLKDVTGESGVAQRGVKAGLRQQSVALDSDESKTRLGLSSLSAAGGMGMGKSGRARFDGAFFKDAEGREKVANTVLNIGAKTFFHKENRWVDSEVTPDEEAKAETIEQFSDRFFELARSQTATENQYLTFDDPIVVRIGGKVYRIDPAKTN
jgi:Ca-activated chloride channel family protein